MGYLSTPKLWEGEAQAVDSPISLTVPVNNHNTQSSAKTKDWSPHFPRSSLVKRQPQQTIPLHPEQVPVRVCKATQHRSGNSRYLCYGAAGQTKGKKGPNKAPTLLNEHTAKQQLFFSLLVFSHPAYENPDFWFRPRAISNQMWKANHSEFWSEKKTSIAFSIHVQVDFDFLVIAQTFDIKTPKMNCWKLQKKKKKL